MSTLRATNIKNESSASNNIVLDVGGGVVVSGVTTVTAGSASAPSISPSGDSNTGIFFPAADTIAFSEGGVESLRIDSSGRLLVGTNTARSNLYNSNNPLVQFETTGNSIPNNWAAIANRNDAFGPELAIGKSRGTAVNSVTAVQSGDSIGGITFLGADGTTLIRSASIYAEIDGTPGTNDMPGRLVFSTTADGAASSTERLRISNSGQISVAGAGSASAPTITKNDDLNTGIFFPAADTIAFAEGGTESARFDSSGRLLIGTTSARTVAGLIPELEVETVNGFPSFSITANTTTAGQEPRIVLGRSKGSSIGSNTVVASGDSLGSIRFAGADGSDLNNTAASIGCEVDGTPGTDDMPGRLIFSTTADGVASPTERMRITNDGRLQIGAVGTVNNEQVRIYAASGRQAITTQLTTDANSHFQGFNSSGTAVIVILGSGNLQNTNNSYGALSDIKLKENIVDAGSQWSDIKSLQVRKYNFKEGQTHTQIGLVAQEVELVSPGLVSESSDCDAEGNDLGTVTKSVNYSVLYMKAVKALQEAMERIEVLESEMADVKSQLA